MDRKSFYPQIMGAFRVHPVVAILSRDGPLEREASPLADFIVAIGNRKLVTKVGSGEKGYQQVRKTARKVHRMTAS